MRWLDVLRSSKYLSVLVVPDGSDKTFGFRVSLGFCRVMALVGLLSLVMIVFGLVNSWKVPSLTLQTKQLKEENTALRQENAKVVQLRKTLADLQQIDDRLRIIAGVGGGRTTPPYDSRAFSGQGRIEDGSDVEGVLPETPTQRILSGGKSLQMSGEQFSSTVETGPSLWPVQGWVTTEYSPSEASADQKHGGIDIAAPLNSPVKAAADGEVISVDNTNEFGNVVAIRHDSSFTSRYGHNAVVLVTPGEQVRRGQTIAFVGSSGRSSASHLHFEIWKDGVPVDPREYLVE